MDKVEAQKKVREWLDEERRLYSNAKHSDPDALDTNYDRWEQGLQAEDAYWKHYINNYWHRTQVLECPTTMVGKQALLKLLAVVEDACTHLFMETGAMPTPGVPSGEITVWE